LCDFCAVGADLTPRIAIPLSLYLFVLICTLAFYV
jgi:hypothetical protein